MIVYGVFLFINCAFAGLSTIEAYNAKTDEWFHVLPMSTRRSSVGVGVVNGDYSFLIIFIDQKEGKITATPTKWPLISYFIKYNEAVR